MATLPVSTLTIDKVWETVANQSTNLKSYIQQVQTAAAAGNVGSDLILRMLAAAVGYVALAKAIQANGAQTTALVAYVQGQPGASGLSVGSLLLATVTAAQTLVTALTGEFPKDGSGHLLDRTFDANGNVVPITLAPTGFPNTAAAMTAYVATVS